MDFYKIGGNPSYKPPGAFQILRGQQKQRITKISGENIEIRDNILTTTSMQAFWTWIPDSRHFQPVLATKFLIESEFALKFAGFQHPGTKN